MQNTVLIMFMRGLYNFKTNIRLHRLTCFIAKVENVHVVIGQKILQTKIQIDSFMIPFDNFFLHY